MAKVIQLAKDLLKGGKKEDIYPKTLDSAVTTTNEAGNTTTLDLRLAEVQSQINRLYLEQQASSDTTLLNLDTMVCETEQIPASGYYSGQALFNEPTKNGYRQSTINDACDWFASGKRVVINTLDNKGYFEVFAYEKVPAVFDPVSEDSSGLLAIRFRGDTSWEIVNISAEDSSETAYYVSKNLYSVPTLTTMRSEIASSNKMLTVAIDANGNITNGVAIGSILSDVTTGHQPVNLYAVLTVGQNVGNYYFTLESCKTVSDVTTVVFSCIYFQGSNLIKMTATASTGDTKFTMDSATIITV